MNPRPASLFLVTRSLCARVDVDAQGRRTHARVLRAPGPDAALALRQLIAFGPAPQPHCGVLLEHLYARTLDVPTRASEWLPGRELEHWHALQLENQSGIPAERAEVALLRLGLGSLGRHRVWVAIGDRAAHAPLVDLLRGAAVEHAWLASPAGLLGAAAEPAIEVWQGATYCGGAGLPCVVAGGLPGRRRWRRSVARWLALVPHARVRLYGKKQNAEACADPRVHAVGPLLSPESVLARLELVARTDPAKLDVPRIEWIGPAESPNATRASTPPVSAVATPPAPAATNPPGPIAATPTLTPPPTERAASIAVPAAAVPVEPPRESVSQNTRDLAAAGVCLALCAIVLWLFLPKVLDSKPARAAELTPAPGASRPTEWTDPTSAPDSTLALNELLALERTRTLALLDALKDETPRELMIARLRRVERHYELEGVAESAAAAENYARALSQRLPPRGWSVGAVRGTRVDPGGAANLWSWSLALEPQAGGASR
jgi:hypothetical protein